MTTRMTRAMEHICSFLHHRDLHILDNYSGYFWLPMSTTLYCLAMVRCAFRLGEVMSMVLTLLSVIGQMPVESLIKFSNVMPLMSLPLARTGSGGPNAS